MFIAAPAMLWTSIGPIDLGAPRGRSVRTLVRDILLQTKVRPFRSRNLGVRRLALVAAIVGAIAGTVWALHHPTEVQTRRWNYAYLRSEQAKYPDASLREESQHGALYLMDCHGEPCGPSPPRWEIVEQFPPDADQPPKWWEYWEYLYLLIPVAVGVAGLWLLVHTVAWVVAGFQIGTNSTRGT